ncbi:MAG: hypothetical protein ACFB51_01175, partial [Anaerolineae bacterium]
TILSPARTTVISPVLPLPGGNALLSGVATLERLSWVALLFGLTPYLLAGELVDMARRWARQMVK